MTVSHAHRGYEYWSPEAAFADETVFIVGGGPSLKGFDFERLRGRRCVAVNSSGYDVPWADILLFHDNSWFEANRTLVDEWRGIAVTLSRHSKVAAPDLLRRVAIEERLDFPIGRGPIRTGHSSGQSALSLTVTMAARQVVLLGFDMKAVAGQTHYHVERPLYTAEHAARTAGEYATTFLPYWAGWNDAALRVGCEVLNATPESALSEFPMVDLKDIL